MSETTTRLGIVALGVLVGLVGVVGIILIALNDSPAPPPESNAAEGAGADDAATG